MNPWILTASGRAFDLIEPTAAMVDPVDIAHSLSRQCRWKGHTKLFYCPTPEQRVLTDDLRWVCAGDLRVGDGLVGFDEYPVDIGPGAKKRRRFRPSRVLTSMPVKRRVIRLELDDGSSVSASEEHPWLVATKQSRNQRWMTVLEVANDVRAGRRRYMHKFVTPWGDAEGYDAGWLAGIFDGEGSVSVQNRRGTQLSIGQNPGLVLGKIQRLLRHHGFRTLTFTGQQAQVVHTQVQGGWREVMRLLGSFRPIRLVDKFRAALRDGRFDKQFDGQQVPLQIVGAYDEGEKECAGLETSTRTYLCEGYGAHNSVAEHCVRVSELVASALALAELDQTGEEARLLTLAALVHDGHEAIIGDVSTPVKRLLGAAWTLLEQRIDAAIGARFSLDPVLMRHPLVKRADAILLATEARDLMPEPPHEWLPADLRPLPTRIEPWTAHEARERFLRALGGLRP